MWKIFNISCAKLMTHFFWATVDNIKIQSKAENLDYLLLVYFNRILPVHIRSYLVAVFTLYLNVLESFVFVWEILVQKSFGNSLKSYPLPHLRAN